MVSDTERVGEEALDQPVAADDALCVLAALLRELERLVRTAGDVAIALEAPDHLVHRRSGQLHRARHVRTRHREARLLQPDDDLQVLLFGDGGMVLGHATELIPWSAPPLRANTRRRRAQRERVQRAEGPLPAGRWVQRRVGCGVTRKRMGIFMSPGSRGMWTSLSGRPSRTIYSGLISWAAHGPSPHPAAAAAARALGEDAAHRRRVELRAEVGR